MKIVIMLLVAVCISLIGNAVGIPIWMIYAACFLLGWVWNDLWEVMTKNE